MINGIIGAGIFGLPSTLFRLSGIYSLLAFAACAIVIFVIILCFAEVSSRFDKTGGPYLYTLTAFGSFPAFAMGWLMLISRIVTYAALINLLITYLSYFIPLLNESLYRVLNIFLITTILTLINFIGVRSSTRVNNFLTIAKVLPLLIFIAIGAFYINPEFFVVKKSLDSGSFSSSVLLLVFAFTGFEAVIINTGEIKNPSTILPFAMLTAIIVVALLYAMIQLISIGTLPELASSEKPLLEAASLFLGNKGSSFIALGAIASILGTLNAVLLVGSRLPYALSMEKQFPTIFSVVHSRFRTPAVSLFFFGLLAFLVSASGSFVYAATISAISKVMIFLVVCISLIKLRKDFPEQQGFFKLSYGIPISILGTAFSLWLLAHSGWQEIKDMTLWMLAGLVGFSVFKFYPKAIVRLKIKRRVS
jgi:basic amino acid/polyamine antiporter, APA family